MKYLFVLNPKSGPAKRAGKIKDLVESLFRETEHKIEFAFTRGPGDATNLARQAVKDGFDIVVAAGGDGTVNEIAAGLVESRCSMGIIPLGSGNGVARSLEIPLGLKASIRTLIKPNIRSIDIGKINEEIFVGVAGTGFDARIGSLFQEFGVRGPIPYFLIGLREFRRYSGETLELICDERKIVVSAFLIAFANTRQYGNGAIIAPDANPSDGILDVCYIEPVSFIRAARLFLKLFRGKINSAPEYHHFQTHSVKIRKNFNNHVFHTDGEPKTAEHGLDITILPGALQVCSR